MRLAAHSVAPETGVVSELKRVGKPMGNEGDAACWLDRVCDDCGAINESPDTAACWRCGAGAVEVDRK